MTKKDYREKIEESRQEIELDDKDLRLSRTSRKVKKGKSPLMTLLLVIFIFIPLTILIYLQVFYEPEVPEQVVEKQENDIVQVEKNDTPTVAVTDDEDEESEADVEADEKKKQQEAARLAEEEKARQEAAEKTAQEQAAKEAQEKAAQEAAEEAARKAAEEAQKTKRTHTVKSNETLYRIAINYYNDPNAVEKIKQANGLSSESIAAGQTLVLP